MENNLKEDYRQLYLAYKSAKECVDEHEKCLNNYINSVMNDEDKRNDMECLQKIKDNQEKHKFYLKELENIRRQLTAYCLDNQ